MYRHTHPAALLVLLATSACDLSPSEVTFDGLPLSPGPHLLLDDYLLEEVHDAWRIVGTPQRDPSIPNPLITGSGDGNTTPYFSVLRENDRFRIWYNTAVDNKGTDQSLLAYMESSDGIHWERPRKFVSGPPGGIRFGASVLPHPEGEGYLLGYHQNGGLRVARSPDGLEWSELHTTELIKQNHDISGLAFDPIRQRYIGIVSTLRAVNAGGPFIFDSRQTQLSISTDLLNWETPWDVLVPDFRDAEGTQFYAMDGFLARGDLLIAMVKILRDDLTATGGVGGMGWTTLAWSRDGRTWTRDRAIFLAPDPTPNTWDHAHAWIDEQVVVGDSVYLYYGGYGSGHKGDRLSDRQIGLVRIPLDRYAGWEGGESVGILRTRPLRLEGSLLTFNVDAGEGEMRVRVVGMSGEPLLGSCAPIRGDQLAAPLRCERDLSSLREPVRLEIELESARLFAWTLS